MSWLQISKARESYLDLRPHFEASHGPVVSNTQLHKGTTGKRQREA